MPRRPLDFTTYVVENFSRDADVAENASAALTSARAAALPVFHVVHEMMLGQTHPSLAPVEDEPVLGTTTIGAFAATNLRERLPSADVGRIIVADVATQGTLLSTARWAFGVGYEVVTCADACADPDPQAHAALLDESIPELDWPRRIASVLQAAEITELTTP